MLTSRPFLVAGALACALGGCNVGSQQGYEPAQPIAYSHAQHAGEYKMDCQYCHYGAARSRHAGVPSPVVCMNCHRQVKKDAPEIKALAEAVDSGKPFAWTRVHRLPDFVYFDHSRHVASPTGPVACQTCHGPVEQMVRVRQVETMSMGWCIDCHRQTAKTSGGKQAPSTDCAACHY